MNDSADLLLPFVSPAGTPGKRPFPPEEAAELYRLAGGRGSELTRDNLAMLDLAESAGGSLTHEAAERSVSSQSAASTGPASGRLRGDPIASTKKSPWASPAKRAQEAVEALLEQGLVSLHQREADMTRVNPQQEEEQKENTIPSHRVRISSVISAGLSMLDSRVETDGPSTLEKQAEQDEHEGENRPVLQQFLQSRRATVDAILEKQVHQPDKPTACMLRPMRVCTR